MQLADLERSFWRIVRAPTPPENAGEHFVSHGALDAARRLGIYHSAYFSRQEQVLVELFPRLSAVLGEEEFHRISRGLILSRPSRTPIIERIAADLPDYLATTERLRPALIDLARLEWARTDALLSPNEPRQLSIDQLSRPDLARCRARFSAAARLLHVVESALFYWSGHLEPKDEGPLAFVVVTRNASTVSHSVLSDEAGRALVRSIAGEPLGEVFSEFTASGVQGAHAALKQFVQLSLWSRLEPVNETSNGGPE